MMFGIEKLALCGRATLLDRRVGGLPVVVHTKGRIRPLAHPPFSTLHIIYQCPRPRPPKPTARQACPLCAEYPAVQRPLHCSAVCQLARPGLLASAATCPLRVRRGFPRFRDLLLGLRRGLFLRESLFAARPAAVLW